MLDNNELTDEAREILELHSKGMNLEEAIDRVNNPEKYLLS